MPYVTSIERIGREAGLREAVRRVVRARFGAVPPALEEWLAAADEPTLAALLDRATLAADVQDLLSGE